MPNRGVEIARQRAQLDVNVAELATRQAPLAASELKIRDRLAALEIKLAVFAGAGAGTGLGALRLTRPPGPKPGRSLNRWIPSLARGALLDADITKLMQRRAELAASEQKIRDRLAILDAKLAELRRRYSDEVS